jgi:DNA-binding CsgD family transcriptional regulator
MRGVIELGKHSKGANEVNLEPAGAQLSNAEQACGTSSTHEKAQDESNSLSALFTRDSVHIFIAMSLLLISTSFMNVSVFPLFDHVFTHARDISVVANAVVLIAIGLAATFRPKLLRTSMLNIAMLAMLLTGCFTLPVALAFANAPGLIVSSSIMAIGRAWCMISAGIAASRLPQKQLSVIIPLAFVPQCLASSFAWVLPIWVGLIGFLVFPVLAWALTWRDALPIMKETEHGDAPVEFSVTQPSSFMPLASQLFVCLFLFHIAFGCSLRFGEVGGVPLSSYASIVPIVIAVAIALIMRDKFPTDLIVQISVLLVVAGFLSMTIQLQHANNVSVVLLAAGNTLFDMVAWLVLIAVASRNSRGAVATFAWGRGVSGLGTTLGAFIGVTSNHLTGDNPDMLKIVLAVIVLVFVAYALIGLKGFSFTEAIEGITPVETATIEIPKQTLEERCRELAGEYSLTPRELEVFQMLARGRDTTYIQEQLVVSRNTVKAHVKHIYAKLDIHSHQDLIDIVEGA